MESKNDTGLTLDSVGEIREQFKNDTNYFIEQMRVKMMKKTGQIRYQD